MGSKLEDLNNTYGWVNLGSCVTCRDFSGRNDKNRCKKCQDYNDNLDKKKLRQELPNPSINSDKTKTDIVTKTLEQLRNLPKSFDDLDKKPIDESLDKTITKVSQDFNKKLLRQELQNVRSKKFLDKKKILKTPIEILRQDSSFQIRNRKCYKKSCHCMTDGTKGHGPYIYQVSWDKTAKKSYWKYIGRVN